MCLASSLKNGSLFFYIGINIQKRNMTIYVDFALVCD